MADSEVHDRLRQELDEELKQFPLKTQNAFRLYFRLEAKEYKFSTEDIAAILKVGAHQIDDMIAEVRSHLDQKGLLDALPSRD